MESLQQLLALTYLPLCLRRKVGGGRTKIGKGDVVSVPATIFDGDDPGSYSNEFPDRCYGTVESVSKKGIVIVNWSDGDVHGVKLKDCRKEQHKLTVASIIVLLAMVDQGPAHGHVCGYPL